MIFNQAGSEVCIEISVAAMDTVLSKEINKISKIYLSNLAKWLISNVKHRLEVGSTGTGWNPNDGGEVELEVPETFPVTSRDVDIF